MLWRNSRPWQDTYHHNIDRKSRILFAWLLALKDTYKTESRYDSHFIKGSACWVQPRGSNVNVKFVYSKCSWKIRDGGQSLCMTRTLCLDRLDSKGCLERLQLQRKVASVDELELKSSISRLTLIPHRISPPVQSYGTGLR